MKLVHRVSITMSIRMIFDNVEIINANILKTTVACTFLKTKKILSLYAGNIYNATKYIKYNFILIFNSQFPHCTMTQEK